MGGLCSAKLDAGASEREDVVSCFPEVGVGEEYMFKMFIEGTC